MFIRAEPGKGRSVIYFDRQGNKLIMKNGSKAWRNNNPGNMEASSFAKRHGSIGSAKRFAWDSARKLLSEDFEAHRPQSKEKIIGPVNFIELNRRYPGTHKIEILNVRNEYDRWDHVHHVVTEVYIESKMPDGKEMKLFAISFFEVNSDDLITSATEYWADTYEAPDWRKDLVERY